eukprot:5525008-Prymnesium_polylepis.1
MRTRAPSFFAGRSVLMQLVVLYSSIRAAGRHFPCRSCDCEWRRSFASSHCGATTGTRPSSKWRHNRCE